MRCSIFVNFDEVATELVKHSTLLFADDCIMCCPINNIYDEEKLQQDIDSVLSWADIWQIKFNLSKCCYIHAHNIAITIAIASYV